MIRLIDVARTYRVGPTSIDALRRVSLSVEVGGRVTVMGSSGSGKTTLVHILALLDRPTAGSYLLDGRDVGALPDDDLAVLRNREIGMVFQGFNLMAHRSCTDNVALPLIYRGHTRERAHAAALDALRRVGMAERAASRARTLSGGQQQRVAIARAIVGSPALLVADEPTGALDRRTGLEIADLLLGLNQAGTTLIVVTHDPEVGARCGNIVELHDGVLAPGAFA